jgi:hypothetical protein
MPKKIEIKETNKKEKAKLNSEVSSIKKEISEYKLERKINWKAFKKKMHGDISELKKSINKLSRISH